MRTEGGNAGAPDPCSPNVPSFSSRAFDGEIFPTHGKKSFAVYERVSHKTIQNTVNKETHWRCRLGPAGEEP